MAQRDERLDRALAALLWWGTWAASALIALGMALVSHAVVKAGVALLIALPALRVATLFGVFALRRDRAALIAALVLAILAAGLLIGVKD